MQQVTSALRADKGGPDVLSEMRVLEAFWTRFGITEETLRSWPPARVKDYITVLRLEAAINSEQKPAHGRSAGGNSGSGPQMSSAEMTEMAFNAMKPEPTAPVGPHPDAATRAERAKLFE